MCNLPRGKGSAVRGRPHRDTLTSSPIQFYSVLKTIYNWFLLVILKIYNMKHWHTEG